MIFAPGTVTRMSPPRVGLSSLASATLVAPSSWGETSDDVTFAAANTQQYPRS